MAGRGATATSSSGGSSDAARMMLMNRMMRSGGLRGNNMLPNLLLMRGAIDPMEYMMCRSNMMFCMMFMQ
ncbi:hypothetical protein ACF0H5_019221 [Mactra antiquata]